MTLFDLSSDRSTGLYHFANEKLSYSASGIAEKISIYWTFRGKLDLEHEKKKQFEGSFRLPQPVERSVKFVLENTIII